MHYRCLCSKSYATQSITPPFSFSLNLAVAERAASERTLAARDEEERRSTRVIVNLRVVPGAIIASNVETRSLIANNGDENYNLVTCSHGILRAALSNSNCPESGDDVRGERGGTGDG